MRKETSYPPGDHSSTLLNAFMREARHSPESVLDTTLEHYRTSIVICLSLHNPTDHITEQKKQFQKELSTALSKKRIPVTDVVRALTREIFWHGSQKQMPRMREDPPPPIPRPGWLQQRMTSYRACVQEDGFPNMAGYASVNKEATTFFHEVQRSLSNKETKSQEVIDALASEVVAHEVCRSLS